MDPSTEIICVGFRWRETLRATGWSAAFLSYKIGGEAGLSALEQLATTFGLNIVPWAFFEQKYAEADRIVAHNIGFERAMICYHLNPLWKLKKPWSCTSARASRMGLPKSLDKLSVALKLTHQKDMEGHKVMMQTAAPRPSWKKHGVGPKWFDDVARLVRLGAYCVADVMPECEAHDLLDELDERETADHEMVQWQNAFGLRVDTALLGRMEDVVTLATFQIEPELERLTGGRVKKMTSVQKIKAELAELGLHIPDLTQESVAGALKGDMGDLHPLARKLLEGRQAVGKVSASKTIAFRNYLCPDDRIRDQIVYHGAHTGRITASGVQILNFPRPYKGFDQEKAIAALLGPSYEAIEALHRPMEVVSSSLRGLLMADEDATFVIGDYSGVETAGLMTAARSPRMLNILLSGKDPYCAIASLVYGYEVIKGKHDIERQLGKTIILGCGYGMSADRFYLQMVEDFTKAGLTPVSRELTDKAHALYRSDNPEVMKFWYGLEYAAKDAIAYYLGDTATQASVIQTYTEYNNAWSRATNHPVYKDGKFGFNDIWYHIEKRAGLTFLVCTLPNGNTLLYPEPQLVEQTKFAKRERRFPSKTPWRDLQLTYYGKLTGTSIWGRVETWGGSLTENVIQKWCREILIDHAQLVVQEVGPILMTVYDEMVTQVADNVVDLAVERLKRIMKTKLWWCPGMPLKSDVFVAKRYKK